MVLAFAGDSTMTMFIEMFLAARMALGQGRNFGVAPQLVGENGDSIGFCQIAQKDG
jgi:hypothetical protein